MNQIRLQTGKADILLVEVPNGQSGFKVYCNDLHYGPGTTKDCGYKALPTDGQWRYIGIAGELTEEQAALLVGKSRNFHSKGMFLQKLISKGVDQSKAWAVLINNKI